MPRARDRPVAEILSGAKASTRPGQDKAACAIEPGEGVLYFLVHANVEAVEAVGAVERDEQDAVAALGEDSGLVGHAAEP